MGQIRVLIVDDHTPVREIMRDLLTRRDMLVVAEAGDGEEGVRQFRAHRPDLTLMDLRMPKMDGLEATRAILAEFPDARIVVLTSMIEQDQACRQAGAVAVVHKDVSDQELIDTLRAIVA